MPELTFIDDGYAGAAYDATASSITPRYIRETGPGYAFVFGGTAFLLNTLLWSIVTGGMWWYRRRRVNPSRPA